MGKIKSCTVVAELEAAQQLHLASTAGQLGSIFFFKRWTVSDCG
jgi:hypothetical protein